MAWVLGHHIDINKVSMESLTKLVSRSPRAKEVFDAYVGRLKTPITVEDINECFVDCDEYWGVGYLVAICMDSALGHNGLFYVDADYDGQYVALVQYNNPWNMPDEYKNLTREQVVGALNNVLGVLYNEENYNDGFENIEFDY